MDVRQIQAFLAVIDHGSFSAAAKALFTVQSNVSAHVAHLEGELRTQLLDRRTRQLTAAGRAVERRGRAILDELAAISDDLAALDDRIVGEVSCGATPSVGRWILPPTLQIAAESLPEVAVTIVEAQSDRLADGIERGALDIAITTGIGLSDRSEQAAKQVPLFDEAIVAVLAKTHPLAQADQITLGDLATDKLLIPLPDNPLHEHITGAFARADVRIRNNMEVGSSNLVVAMAAAGVGIALVPATAITDPTGTTQRTPLGLDPRRVALVTSAGPRTPTAVQALGAIIEETGRAASQHMPGCTPVAAQSDIDQSTS